MWVRKMFIFDHLQDANLYQALDNTVNENAEIDETDVVISQFLKAVRVFEAATWYRLPGLQ